MCKSYNTGYKIDALKIVVLPHLPTLKTVSIKLFSQND